MSITLNWNLPAGITLDNVVIYRGTAALDKNNLPAPLATLAGDVATYVDDALVSNNVYYYIVSFVKGADVSYSMNYEMGYFADLGPGPQKLVMGNWTYGYFGEIAAADFITAADLKTQVGASSLSVTEPVAWHKFIYKGKILFVPDRYMAYSSWNALYALGLIFGTDDNGVFPTGASKPTPVNQNKRAIARGNEFIVRCPKVKDDLTTYFVAASMDPLCEAAQTIGRLGLIATSRGIGRGQYSDINPSSLYAATQNAISSAYYAHYILSGDSINAVPGTNSIYWMPILELVV